MKNSLASDALKLTSANLMTRIISLITAMLLSRFRSLDEYGTYAQLIMVINLATTVFMLGLPNSINYFLPRAETSQEKQQFVSVYYTFSTLLCILTGLVLVLSTEFIVGYFSNPMIRKFIYVLALYPWATIILASINNMLVVHKKTQFLLGFKVANSLALLGIILLVEAFQWGFSQYVLLFVIVESLFALSVYGTVRQVSGALKPGWNPDLVRDILKFSTPVGLATVVGTLSIQLDKLLIGRFFDLDQLAIYTNAAREMPVTFIASSITAVILPYVTRKLSKGESMEAMKSWKEAITLSFIIMCFLSTALFVLAPQAMTFLYSAKYLPGTDVFRIYSLLIALRCTYFGMVLSAMGKTRYILRIAVFQLVLNVMLNFIFYRIFGFIGPALATIVSMIITSSLYMYLNAKVAKVHIGDILAIKELLAILGINLAFGGGVALVVRQMGLGTTSLHVAIAIGIGCLWMFLYGLVMKKKMMSKWTYLSKIK